MGLCNLDLAYGVGWAFRVGWAIEVGWAFVAISALRVGCDCSIGCLLYKPAFATGSVIY